MFIKKEKNNQVDYRDEKLIKFEKVIEKIILGTIIITFVGAGIFIKSEFDKVKKELDVGTSEINKIKNQVDSANTKIEVIFDLQESKYYVQDDYILQLEEDIKNMQKELNTLKQSNGR